MDSEQVEMTMVVRGNSREDGSLYTISPSGVSPKDLDLVENFRFCPIHTRARMIIPGSEQVDLSGDRNRGQVI
jgi:hypothetical protein